MDGSHPAMRSAGFIAAGNARRLLLGLLPLRLSDLMHSSCSSRNGKCSSCKPTWKPMGPLDRMGDLGLGPLAGIAHRVRVGLQIV